MRGLKHGNPPLSLQVAGFFIARLTPPHGNTGGNKMLRKTLVLLAMLLPTTAAAQAQDTIIMEPVVVTASRINREVSRTPAHVSIIDEEKITNSNARNIPELLRNETGIFVTDTTGNGRTYNIDLRGFGETSGQNVLLLIDGRRVNQTDLSGIDWSLISLERIRRIEIVRGSRGSVLYGDNATGGVINIITKEGGDFNIGGGISYGSYDTFNANIFNSGGTHSLSYSLSTVLKDTDGYRDNSDSETRDIGVSFKFYPNDLVSFDISGDYHQDKTGLPGALLLSALKNGTSRTATDNPDDYAETEDYYLKGGSEIFFNGDSSIRMDASFRQRHTEASFSFGDVENTIETVSLNPRLLLKNQIRSIDNSLIFGIDYQDAKAEATNTLGKFRLDKKTYGIYFHDELALNDKLMLTAGYRHDRARYNYDTSSNANPEYKQDIISAGVSYRYYRSSYVYFSYADGYRYPAVDEIFSYFGSSVNTGIKPQQTKNYELGLKHFITDDFTAHINLFHLNTNDEIFYNPVTFSNENFEEKTRRQGIEISIKKSFSLFELGGSYTYTKTNILGGQFKDNKIPNVPEHMATVHALVRLTDQVNFNVNGNYIGKRYYISDFNNTSSKQDNFMVFNTRIQYNYSDFITFYLNLNNIFDEKYAEYGVQRWDGDLAVYPSPRFNALAGLTVRY
jgi:iron complex outermembrane receptor protein